MPDAFTLPGLEITERLQKSLEEDGIQTPTEIQRLAFAPILAGKHVVVDSGTGTGKTLAYLLPLLQRLENEKDQRVVVLSPATELAVQTLGVASRYCSEDLKTGSLVGGGNQKKQKDRVQKSTRLVMGTPGRVLEMIANRKLKAVTTFVLDEPEPILSSKDARFLVEVLSRPPRPQIVICGATFGVNSERLVKEFMAENLERAESSDSPLTTQIEHFRRKVRDAADRDLQLARFLEQECRSQAIVYVNQSHLIRHVYRYLVDSGIATATLSSDRTKQQCQQALREFTKKDVQVLLTTDRAATGLDVPSVPWVVHYEPPRSAQAYVHRAGRSGRAGQQGRSLALVSDQERFILRDLERDLGIEVLNFGTKA